LVPGGGVGGLDQGGFQVDIALGILHGSFFFAEVKLKTPRSLTHGAERLFSSSEE
jgi:hypothetical protein